MVQVMVVVIVVVILAVVLFPLFSMGHRPPPGVPCLSNLKQIGMGMLVYASDEGDRLPPAPKWMDEISPHIHSRQILRCPVVKKQSSEGYGYAFNRHLEASKLGALKSPSEVPLAYDSINLARNAADFVTSLPNPGRHEGKNNIVRADSSAKSYPLAVPGG
jgi:hypothetical protein